MSDTEYLALLQLRTRNFAAQVALGISKICHVNLEITEGLVSYCQHFAMAIALFQELILLSYETHHTYNLFEVLKITCCNYPLIYGFKIACEEERTLMQRATRSLSERTALAKPIYKILQSYRVEERIKALIQMELEAANKNIVDLEFVNHQALFGLSDLFLESSPLESSLSKDLCGFF